MKKIKQLGLLMLGLFVVAACTTEDFPENPLEKDSKLTFYSTIGEPQLTRATATSWEQGDAIGVYALTAGQTLPGGIYNERANIKYTTATTNGLFTAASTGIYFLDPADKLDFVSYYPYKESIVDYKYPVNVANQSNPAAIDLLYSDNAKNAGSTTPTVNLNFNHMLSQLVFSVSAGDGVASLAGLTASTSDAVINGTFDLIRGETVLGNTKQKINLQVYSTGTGEALVSAILPPGQNLEDAVVSFTLNGLVYKFTLGDLALNPTYKYTYQLVLSTDGLIAVDVNATITDWNEGNPGGDPITLTPEEDGSTGPDPDPSDPESPYLNEPFDTSQGQFTIYDTQLPEGGSYVWQWDSYKYMKASSFIGGSAKASESWLISPAMNLTGVTKAELTFDHAINFAGTMNTEQTAWVSTNYSSGNPSAATWTPLSIPAYPAGNSWDFVESGVIALPASVLGQPSVHIAFKYVSSASNAATWEIKNVLVTDGTTPTPDPDPDPDPTPDGLLFPGGDFEDWNAFLTSLNSFGLKSYVKQADGGRTGKAFQLNGNPLTNANDYVFTNVVPASGNPMQGKSKIIFYVKGTSAKSISLNVYKDNGTGQDRYYNFNLGSYTEEVILSVAANNQYNGSINTGGQWMKVTLDISGLDDLETVTGNDMFALKVGSASAYDLLLDDFTIE